MEKLDIICAVCGGLLTFDPDTVSGRCTNCGAVVNAENYSDFFAPCYRTSGDADALDLLAENARAVNDFQKALDYYSRIAERRPYEWEAAFFFGFFRAMTMSDSMLERAGNQMETAGMSALKKIVMNVEDADARQMAILVVVSSMSAGVDRLYARARDRYVKFGNDAAYTEYVSNAMAIIQSLYILGTELYEYKDRNIAKMCFLCFEKTNEMMVEFYKSIPQKYPERMANVYRTAKSICDKAAEKIRTFKPGYHSPMDDVTPPKSGASSEGCYIATAVYGSYDCPQVWTLRRFRDGVLGKSVFGRLFIRLYYAFSPALVAKFGDNSRFRNFWRVKLDTLVERLRAQGLEGTPYNDVNWRKTR